MPADRQLRNHWYRRPGWSSETRYLTWHLLPPAEPSLRASVTQSQQALSTLTALDLVPPRWLHLTLQGFAFADRTARATVDAVVAAARKRIAEVPSVTLDLAAPVAIAEGVAMFGTPALPVAEVRRSLRRAMAEVVGAGNVPGGDDEPVEPHLSLAYANAAVAVAEVEQALARIDARRVTVTLPSVSLIELRVDHHCYRWDVVADVPFAAR